MASTHPSPKRRLGDFEIVRELGRGGMGVVYEARQVSLNRKVALKVLSGALGLTSKAVVRFQREAEAAAKLHHTNIVPIYATGEQDGTHYFAMELIEGPGLDQVIAQMRESEKAQPVSQQQEPAAASLNATTASQTASPVGWAARTMGFQPPAAASDTTSETHGLSSSSLSSGNGYFDTVAKMMAEVADALDYAHAQGVIHRDIKPSNLLLSPVGRLSMNDFGLARMLEQPGMTVSGEFVGSPMYMSPEQIAVGRAPLDHRTDIYSLGATLYELLTLQPPFQGVRRDQVIAQIMHKEPKPLQSINRKIPQDLETICLKMMEKDPDKRYQKAGAVAEDLRRYVNRFAISARRIGPWGRTARWVKRHKSLSAMLACLMVAIVVTGVLAWQLRAEKCQVAMNEALDYTTACNYERAQAAIEKARRLGASEGFVEMLYGYIEYQKGNQIEAVRRLKRAAQLEPKSMAVRSLLAAAHYLAWDGVGDILDTLDELTPVTAEDYLFWGHAVTIEDPIVGLQHIQQGFALRPQSAIAYFMRSEALIFVASNRANVEMARDAMGDIKVFKGMVPGKAIGVAQSLFVNMLAADVFNRSQREKECQEARNMAHADAKELMSTFLDDPRSQFALPVYFYWAGKTDKTIAVPLAQKSVQLKEQALAKAKVRDPMLLGFCAWDLAYLGEFTRARKYLDEARSSHSLDMTYILAMDDQRPNALKEALDNYNLTLDDGDLNGFGRLYCQNIYCLAGDREKSLEVCRKLAQQPDSMPRFRHAFRTTILKYMCGDMSEKAFLEGTKGSLWDECEAHYFIAMRLLSERNREGAMEHFQACMDTDNIIFGASWWSRILLKHMERNPDWPQSLWQQGSTAQTAPSGTR